MLVRDVMTKSVETLSNDASVVDAAKQMAALNVGVVPVGQEEACVGIVTDRDIVTRVIALERDPATVQVSEIMSNDIADVRDDTDLIDAAQTMKERQVRRLVVNNERGALVGMLSLGDLAAKPCPDATTMEVLRVVSMPAAPVR